MAWLTLSRLLWLGCVVTLGANARYPVKLVINVTKTLVHQTIKFDACQIISCGNLRNQRALSRSEKYLCPEQQTSSSPRYTGPPCPDWSHVWWTTQYQGWTAPNSKRQSLKSKLHMFKGAPDPNCQDLGCNPILLTIKGPDSEVNRTYGFGIDLTGKDPTGRFRIEIKNPPKGEKNIISGPELTSINDPNRVEVVEVKELRQTLEIETGYGDTNAWVEWVKFTVHALNKSDCFACAAARPQAQLVPFPLGWDTDPRGMYCMLALYQDKDAWGNETCKSLSLLFPALQTSDSKAIPAFSVGNVNYSSCLSRQGAEFTRPVGELATCTSVLNVTSGPSVGNYSALRIPRADVWWYCGKRNLHNSLPPDWTGTCALVQLVIPFTLAFHKGPKKDESNHRARRAIAGSFDSNIYIDAIGAPRGVPDEFKARNQVAAGFESVFFHWVTVNKNVAWINYIYYNQQRFINYTRDALQGVASQLDATSRMTWENRIALDMILAEKGGVCVMLGKKCCTFIPNNTAPDGTVTKALQGLRTLANELVENAGIDDPLTGWLGGWSGNWKGLMASILSTLMIIAGVLIAVGCCIIPCVRGLAQRLIEAGFK